MKGDKMTETNWMDNFGDNLKSLLQEAWMSQQELADAIGVSRETVSRYINKQRIPSLITAINIAYALDCNIAELIDFGEPIK